MNSERILHTFQEHLIIISLSVVLCIGVGTTVGLVCFYFAEPYSLLEDARKSTAWIAAMIGSIVCCGIVFAFDITLSPLTFAGYLFFGAVTSIGSGLLPLTFGLPVLRRLVGVLNNEQCAKSHRGKERLKD